MSNFAPLVPRYRALFLRSCPQSYARMNKPSVMNKYTKVLDPRTRTPLIISDAAIVQHLAGHATYAAPLIGADGCTYEVALDIDMGGEAAIVAGLHIATQLGFNAYGLVSQAGAGKHNGGHIRIPLAVLAAPERARMLAEQIQQALIIRCGLPEKAIEVYPTQKGLRLPFGVHTYTGKRGTLLLQDGTRLELDEGEPLTTITQALTLVEGLSPNSPDTLPLPPTAPISRIPVSPPNALQRTNGGSPIQDYNYSTNLLDWLVSIGGRVAGSMRGGGYILHCPCNNHKHQDARPSLEIQTARNPRHGSYVIIGHAPGCLFATERGKIVDAFDAYCRWHGLSVRDALDTLRRNRRT